MKKEWKWSQQKEHAALLCACGDLTTEDILKRAGIARSTLFAWKHHAEFNKRIREHQAELTAKQTQKEVQDYNLRRSWREDTLQKLKEIVGNITPEELAQVKRNPIAAINLLIRLESSVEQIEKRKQKYDDYNGEEDDYPFDPDMSPETEQRIMQVLQQIQTC